MFKLLLLLTLVPCVAFGQSVTGVSGTISNDEAVTITGSGFGTKSTAAPLRWDTFEDGTVGADISSQGYWSDDGEPPTFSNTNQRLGGSNNALVVLAGVQDMFYKNNLNITNRILLDFWFRVEEAPEVEYQLKLWGAAQSYPSTVTPAIGDFLWERSGGSKSRYIQIYGTDSSDATDYTSWPTSDTWTHLCVEIDQGTVGGDDAIITTFENCVRNSRWIDANLIQDTGDNMDSVKFGWYLGNGGSTTNTQFDDVYIDNSWARVELGDNAAYASCTHREIQPITSWSTTSVGVDLNTGSFSTDDTAYLFVVDSDGTASAGYPVIIGGETTPGVTPPAVTDLTATGGN